MLQFKTQRARSWYKNAISAEIGGLNTPGTKMQSQLLKKLRQEDCKFKVTLGWGEGGMQLSWAEQLLAAARS